MIINKGKELVLGQSHVVIDVDDTTNIQEPLPIPGPSMTAMFIFRSSRGPINETIKLSGSTAYSDAIDMFGEPNTLTYGPEYQSMLDHIQSGGSANCIRLRDPDFINKNLYKKEVGLGLDVIDNPASDKPMIKLVEHVNPEFVSNNTSNTGDTSYEGLPLAMRNLNHELIPSCYVGDDPKRIVAKIMMSESGFVTNTTPHLQHSATTLITNSQYVVSGDSGLDITAFICADETDSGDSYGISTNLVLRDYTKAYEFSGLTEYDVLTISGGYVHMKFSNDNRKTTFIGVKKFKGNSNTHIKVKRPTHKGFIYDNQTHNYHYESSTGSIVYDINDDEMIWFVIADSDNFNSIKINGTYNAGNFILNKIPNILYKLNSSPLLENCAIINGLYIGCKHGFIFHTTRNEMVFVDLGVDSYTTGSRSSFDSSTVFDTLIDYFESNDNVYSGVGLMIFFRAGFGGYGNAYDMTFGYHTGHLPRNDDIVLVSIDGSSIIERFGKLSPSQPLLNVPDWKKVRVLQIASYTYYISTDNRLHKLTVSEDTIEAPNKYYGDIIGKSVNDMLLTRPSNQPPKNDDELYITLYKPTSSPTTSNGLNTSGIATFNKLRGTNNSTTLNYYSKATFHQPPVVTYVTLNKLFNVSFDNLDTHDAFAEDAISIDVHSNRGVMNIDGDLSIDLVKDDTTGLYSVDVKLKDGTEGSNIEHKFEDVYLTSKGVIDGNDTTYSKINANMVVYYDDNYDIMNDDYITINVSETADELISIHLVELMKQYINDSDLTDVYPVGTDGYNNVVAFLETEIYSKVLAGGLHYIKDNLFGLVKVTNDINTFTKDNITYPYTLLNSEKVELPFDFGKEYADVLNLVHKNYELLDPNIVDIDVIANTGEEDQRITNAIVGFLEKRVDVIGLINAPLNSKSVDTVKGWGNINRFNSDRIYKFAENIEKIDYSIGEYIVTPMSNIILNNITKWFMGGMTGSMSSGPQSLVEGADEYNTRPRILTPANKEKLVEVGINYVSMTESGYKLDTLLSDSGSFGVYSPFQLIHNQLIVGRIIKYIYNFTESNRHTLDTVNVIEEMNRKIEPFASTLKLIVNSASFTFGYKNERDKDNGVITCDIKIKLTNTDRYHKISIIVS